jgi:hypothetical protein
MLPMFSGRDVGVPTLTTVYRWWSLSVAISMMIEVPNIVDTRREPLPASQPATLRSRPYSPL